MRADLHVHSYYSDGSESPAGVVACAREAGLQLLALTDHDSMGGIEEARAAAEAAGIQLIHGAEFTATVGGAEIHILGYFPFEANEDVRAHLWGMQQFRRRRLETACERLRRSGIELDAHELPASPRCESLTTMHLARLLTLRGYASSPRAAWRRYMARERRIVPMFEITAEEVIRVIHVSGGLAVWAHPGPRRLERQLVELIALGLDGIEVYNGRRGDHQGARWLARKYDLVVTGGSDWHGEGPLGVEADDLPMEPFLRRMGPGA